VQAQNGCLCQIVIMKSATPSIQVNKRHEDAMRFAGVAVSLLSGVWRSQKTGAGITDSSRKAHPGFECLDSSEPRQTNKQSIEHVEVIHSGSAFCLGWVCVEL
jgi:hypothetical protein